MTNYLDETIPDNLPEVGFDADLKVWLEKMKLSKLSEERFVRPTASWAGRLAEFGIVETPKWKQERVESYKGAIYPRIVVVGVEPYSFAYDTNPTSYIFEQNGNLAKFYCEHRSPDGEIKTAGSVFGRVKAAFALLGVNLTDAASFAEARGKNFRWVFCKETFGDNPTFYHLPISRLPNDYKFEGTRKPMRRGYDRNEAPPPTFNNPDAIVNALEGKTENEIIMALATNGLGEYVDAATKPGFVNQLQAIGLRLVDGKFTR